MRLETKKAKQGIACVFLLSIIFFLLVLVYSVEADTQTPVEASQYISGEIIVKFFGEGPNAVLENVQNLYEAGERFSLTTADSSDSLDNLFIKYEVTAVKTLLFRTTEEVAAIKEKFNERAKRAPRGVEFKLDLGHIYVLKVNSVANIEEACQEFAQDKHVEYCHPNYVLSAQSIYNPDDPYLNSIGSWGQAYSDMWDLRKINLINEEAGESAWDLTQGEGIVVAVIDSGVDYNNVELKDNVWVNINEISGNGIDDDSNGYIDDIKGWNFSSNTNNPIDNTYGHGTWVSGIIASRGNNASGLIGVAPGAKIMPLKVTFNLNNLAPITEIVSAINYALMNGADVINLSLSPASFNPVIPSLEDAIKQAHSFGVVIVVAAGNINNDVVFYSPANMAETITVSGTDFNDNKAKFQYSNYITESNFGEFIDVAAPGIDVFTLNPSGQTNLLSLMIPQLNVTNDYYRAQGTSMSTAIVSGMAALLLAHNVNLTNEDIRQIMRVSADDIGLPGRDINFGYGRVNVLRALSFERVPGVKIVSPGQKDVVNLWDNTFEVKASLYGYNLMNYNIAYRDINAAEENWIDLTGEVPLLSSEKTVQNILVAHSLDLAGFAVGTYLIRIQLNTVTGLTFEDTVQFVATKLNNPPVFAEIVGYNITAGEELTFNVSAVDPDFDAVSISLVSEVSGAQFKEGLLTWRPSEYQVGIHSFIFEAYDGKDGRTLSAPVGVVVYAAPQAKINYPKESTSFDIWQETVAISASVGGDNLKEYEISYRSAGSFGGDWILIKSGNIASAVDFTSEWAIKDLAIGEYELMAQVRTLSGLSSENIIKVNIVNLNHAPEFVPVSDITVKAGDLVSFSVVAADSDSDIVKVSAVSLPAGATFEGKKFNWITDKKAEGTYAASFKAFDGKDGESILNVVINLTKNNENKNKPPKMLYVRGTKEAIFWLGADEEDGMKIKYSYRVDGKPWSEPKPRVLIRIDNLKREYNLSSGKHTFKVKAVDKKGDESKEISTVFDVAKGKSSKNRGK